MSRVCRDGNGNGAESTGCFGARAGATRCVQPAEDQERNGYVILTNPRYDLRRSQEKLNAYGPTEERREQRTESNEFLDRLVKRPSDSALIDSVECCCPRVPFSRANSCTASAWSLPGSLRGTPSRAPRYEHQQYQQSQQHQHQHQQQQQQHQRQSTEAPTNSINSRPMPRTFGVVGSGQQYQPRVAQSFPSLTTSTAKYPSSASSTLPSSSATPSPLPPPSPTATSVVQFVFVPLQLAQWTKHSTHKLQEPTTIAVDRLQKFRWSGGGGGSGKKSPSGPRSDKAERLRELTEKLKGSTPVPPPRRTSRSHASSPPLIGKRISQESIESSVESSLPSDSPECAIVGRHAQRRPLGGTVSVDEVQRVGLVNSSSTVTTVDPSHRTPNGDDVEDDATARRARECAKHPRQYSDSVVESVTRDEQLRLALLGNETRDSLSRLEPRGPLCTTHRRTGAPYRSASFGQVDFDQNTRQREEDRPVDVTANRDAGVVNEGRSSTLPRRRDEAVPITVTGTRDSPRASTPSVDSAVGSVEGLGVAQIIKDDRPRSDGSDSLATSSAVTSPEPTSTDSRQSGASIAEPGIEIINLAEPSNLTTDTSHRDSKLELHKVVITPPPDDPRLSQASEGSEAPSETASENSSPSGKSRRHRGDTSKRRKGVYITQWPLEADKNKLATQSSDERDEPPATPSDLSDCEGPTSRRYSKRPLRGPYGQMLEAEMAKPRTTDIALEEDLRPRRKVSANLSYNAETSSEFEPLTPCHHRTTSSPSKLEGLPAPSPELLAELLRGSSERVARAPTNRNDTRTHVVVELYDTERSYVESLQVLVNKYLQSLKSPENTGLIDVATVDEIFYQVPTILSHHEVFLDELRRRLDTWEDRQTIGDIFLDVFTKPDVLETYSLFLDNWKSAKKAIKEACQTKPAFARFLETMEREHKGKLGLDQLLIKPVQKIPRYELLLQRLLKHTEATHPDHQLLAAAQKEVHELVVKINCTERESLEWEQQQTTLKEVQSLVEGLAGIVANDRTFIRHDLVTIATNQYTRKERALFLFSDLLVITSIKRRSGTIRKPSTGTCSNNLVSLLEANKYKMLMRISLDDLEIVKAKDENLKRMAREVDNLREDCTILGQIQELVANLHGAKQQLEDVIKEMLSQAQRQLSERNTAHSHLSCLELTINTPTGMENISIIFTKPDKRTSWEESFVEAKQKLALSADRRPTPEFVGPLPIRKTRAGLQFTCAAPTFVNQQGPPDVWVCNSDGYVGQVCVLSLNPEPPQVTSCNGVCNARILCVAGIPSCTNSTSSSDESDEDIPHTENSSAYASNDKANVDSSTVKEEVNQPTMWLGTEDGYIHVYNCNDNIRIKKNKIKIQHGSAVLSITYLDNKVFVSLANGDVIIYNRDQAGGWNSPDPITISVGTSTSPVTKMLSVSGKLWCGCHNAVRVLNTQTIEIEHTFTVGNDSTRAVSCMANSGGLGVWISMHNSAILRLFHATNYECLTDINVAPAVTKMLASCDDIIRQHKAACLRVTALLACSEILWIGTSAGVLLTVPIPHIKPSTQRMSQSPIIIGVPHGHTGHVRFLTCVELRAPLKSDQRPESNRFSATSNKIQSNLGEGKLLVISGGDGYEDFRGPQSPAELQAGREDSTNHLLLWRL